MSVGKVVGKERAPQGNGTLVTIEMANKFAPIHKDATAMLRIKTLLGENYIDLTPGRRRPPLPDGATLPASQVKQAVQLDQIFNTFDPQTRAAFRSWQQSLAIAVKGNDQNLNNVLGQPAGVRGQPDPAAPGARRRAQRCRLAGPQRRHDVQRAQPRPGRPAAT